MGLSSQLDFIRSLLLRLHSLSKRRRRPVCGHAVGCVGRLRSLNIPTLSSLRSWREELPDMSRSSRRKKKKKQQSFRLEFEDEVFVSPDGIPSEEEEFASFTAMHPSYLETLVVDELREEEYGELQEDGHVCLDYSGYGLFSQLQQELDSASSSFAISYISGDLSIQALHGEPEEGTVEFDIRRRVMRFLNIQEGEYGMVFTASKGFAFKLLAESYPFDAQRSLLTMFDYESEAVSWMEEIAQRQGAQTLNASFNFPSLSVCSADLKAQILHKKMDKEKNKKKVEDLERMEEWEVQRKKKKRIEQGGPERKKGGEKGLFVFPVQSRVTGTKYSYQWMSLAQDNGWHVLLDASALGPKDMDSLALSLFQPDFIVTSFYKVFGSDPTGFGCLFVKNSAMGILCQSSAARDIGMVRLIPFPGMSSSNVFSESLKDEDDKTSPGMEIVQEGILPENQSTKEEPGHAEVAFSGPVSTLFRWRQSRRADTKKMVECLEKSGKENESEVEGSASSAPSKNALQGSTRDEIHDVGRTLKDGSVDLGKGKIPFTPRSVLEESLTEGQDQSYDGESPELDESIGSGLTRQEEPCHCFEPGEASSKESVLLDHLESLHEPQGSMHCTSVPVRSPPKALDKRWFLAYHSHEIARGADSFIKPGAFSQPLTSHNIKRNLSVGHSDGSLYYAGSQEELEFSSSLYDEDEESSEFDIADDASIVRREPEIYCRGLNHADCLGLNKTNDRLRFLINWLISSMLKLQHLVSNKFRPLVHLYGPKVKYDRGASLAFNLFDGNGALIRPVVVQKLADRNNISLGMGVLSHIQFPEKCPDLQFQVEENHGSSPRFRVVTAALGFFTNFEDVYRLWVFVAKFLDADFVKHEMCCYHALNQEQVVLEL